MADDWLAIGSSELDSLCGDEVDWKLADALDGVGCWGHQTSEVHWFILDLGQTYTIKKLRGRSVYGYDPIDVDVYVSDSKVDWGTAVATGISTWQDTNDWVEVDSTDKDGRYIKAVINVTEDGDPGRITWGKSDGTISIFDAYGDVAAAGLSIPVAMRTYRNLRVA